VRVLVVGAGAIGSLFGFLIARAGIPVALVGRPSQVEAIRSSGIRVEGLVEGTESVESTGGIPTESAPDLVLLAVKAGDVRTAGEMLARSLSAPMPVVALQNGLGIEAELAAGLSGGGWAHPEDQIVRAVNSYAATALAAGSIRYAGVGEVLLPAVGDPGSPSDRAAAALGAAGIQVRRVPDIAREVWRKLLVNAAINPVTADHGVVNGALRNDPLRGQALRLLREAQLVARAEGYDFPDTEADAELWRVVRATAENRSSMLQDIERGRSTEVEWISGALLSAGERHGLDLPETRRALARVHRRESLGPSQPS
jgi:2-dehydropantoate 2-reductase